MKGSLHGACVFAACLQLACASTITASIQPLAFPTNPVIGWASLGLRPPASWASNRADHNRRAHAARHEGHVAMVRPTFVAVGT